jgi:hypothetical protein
VGGEDARASVQAAGSAGRRSLVAGPVVLLVSALATVVSVRVRGTRRTSIVTVPLALALVVVGCSSRARAGSGENTRDDRRA